MALFTKKYSKPGSAPGEVLQVSSDAAEIATLKMMDFSEQHLVEESEPDLETIKNCYVNSAVAWLHVQGHPSAKLLNQLGEIYGLHTLALEDVMKAGQRTKIEPYDDHLFLLVNIPVESDAGPHAEQVSFFLGKRFLLSIHQGDEDLWELVRQRLRSDPPRKVRSSGADYLLYALLDATIDHSFPYIEKLAETIETTEESIFKNPEPELLDAIHAARHKLIFLRRLLWPQRELINMLLRDESALIHEHTRVFLRDCYDHTIQIMELVESYHEVTASMHDLYLSSLSNRMNEVMKVLTMIATIFIPLSFVVGLYGMNFKTEVSPWNMPETTAYYGYPILLLLMLGGGIAMVLYFKRKGWF